MAAAACRENDWGTFNGMTPRDSQLFKRLGTILRFVGGHEYHTAYTYCARNLSVLVVVCQDL